MKYLSIFSGLFLLSVFFFGWGFLTVEYKVYPWPVLNKVKTDVTEYIKGGGTNKKTISEKIVNDAGIRPDRMLVPYKKSGERPYEEVPVEGLKKRRSAPVIYKKADKAFSSGYVLIWGCFDFKKHMFGALLLDPNGSVVHQWVPNEDDLDLEVKAFNNVLPENGEKRPYYPPEERFPHGLVVFSDGSIVFNDGDHGNGMQKIDFCSRTQWIKLGLFNHTIAKDPFKDGLWTMDGFNRLHKIDAKNGETLKIIPVGDIVESNPDIDIFNNRKNYTDGDWFFDYWHINDIEPLPVELEKAFPQFKAGDLLLSMRSCNTLFVMDQETEEIKWWRSGASSRQHDPDWQPTGIISVYDNRMRDKNLEFQPKFPPKFSRITGVTPQTYESEVLYDGEKDGFYSNIRGKHQILPDGSILITSAMQGRLLLVDKSGDTLFEFINQYDDAYTMMLSEAVWLPCDYFNAGVVESDCSGETSLKKKRLPGADLGIHYSRLKGKVRNAVQKIEPPPLDIPIAVTDDKHIVFDGWLAPEEGSRRNKGRRAFIHFLVPDSNTNELLTINLRLHTMGPQKINGYLNDTYLGAVNIDYSTKSLFVLDLPATLLKPSVTNSIKIEFYKPVTKERGKEDAFNIELYDVMFTKKTTEK